MLIRVLLIGYLLFLSIVDIVWKKIPIPALVAGGILSAASLAYSLAFGRANAAAAFISFGAGLIPGILLLAVSFVTKKAGWGDGVVVCVLGSVENYLKGVIAVTLGGFLMALLAVVLLLLKKVTKSTPLPYIPFLTAGYLLSWLVVGG